MAMQETTKSNYDTLAAVRRLTEAGMPEAHAEAVVREQAHLMENQLATKTDIAAIQADIKKLRLETKADIETLRLETTGSIEKLRLETTGSIETLREETKSNIAVANNQLIKWVVGTDFALLALIIAAIKLL